MDFSLKFRNALKIVFTNAFEPAFSRIDCRKSQLLFRESAISNGQLFRILWTLFVNGLKFVNFEKISENITPIFELEFSNLQKSTRHQKVYVKWQFMDGLKSGFHVMKAGICGYPSIKSRLQTRSYFMSILKFQKKCPTDWILKKSWLFSPYLGAFMNV